MSKLLKDGFGMNGDEIFDFLSTSEQNVNLFCTTELKSLFNNLVNQYLLRKFSLGFKRDEKGNNRNWKEIEEPKIKDLFEVNKKKVEDFIDEFKLIGFPKRITRCEDPDFGQDDDFVEDSEFHASAHIEKTNDED